MYAACALPLLRAAAAPPDTCARPVGSTRALAALAAEVTYFARSRLRFDSDVFVPMTVLRSRAPLDCARGGSSPDAAVQCMGVLLAWVSAEALLPRDDLLRMCAVLAGQLAQQKDVAGGREVLALRAALQSRRTATVAVPQPTRQPSRRPPRSAAGSGSTGGVAEGLEQDDVEPPPKKRRRRGAGIGFVAEQQFFLVATEEGLPVALVEDLLAQPGDTGAANALVAAFLRRAPLRDLAPMEATLPVNRLFLLRPTSLPLRLLRGHWWVGARRHSDALDDYLTAYRADPSQPLTALCIAAIVVFLSVRASVGSRQEVYSKGLGFLLRYKELRLSGEGDDEDAVDEAVRLRRLALLQEVLYNTGRVFAEVALPHLAEKMYRRARAVAEEEPRVKLLACHVTFEAAHNLVLIYRNSGATSLALDVMLKHLRFA